MSEVDGPLIDIAPLTPPEPLQRPVFSGLAFSSVLVALEAEFYKRGSVDAWADDIRIGPREERIAQLEAWERKLRHMADAMAVQVRRLQCWGREGTW